MTVVNNLGSFEFDFGGLFGLDTVSFSPFGDDTLEGGPGNDLLIAGLGNNTLNGNGGNDTLFGGFGNNTLNGGPGNDLLQGGPGDDIMNGGPGQDTFFTSQGNDIIEDFSPPGMVNKTLNFDDLGYAGDMPYEYEGFNWIRAAYLSRPWAEINPGFYPGSGYVNVINSEDNFILQNYSETPAEISRSTNDFDFNSGFFAVGLMNNATLTIRAYDDGSTVPVGEATIVLGIQKVFVDLENTTATGAVSANFTGRFTSIDKVTFVGTGGEDAGVSPFADPRAWTAADDLSFGIMGEGDLIALPMGINPAEVIGSATSDGAGGTFLNQGGDTAQLLGVPPTDIAEAWFI